MPDFRSLIPEQIKMAILFGSQETLARGTVMLELGDREVDFL